MMDVPLRQSSRLLINEAPMQVLPSLAVAVGLNEALFLQQLHYWLHQSGHVRDGRRWVYNSLDAWHKQFPFWSLSTLRRTIDNLISRGLLLTGNYNTSKIDRTKWYTIDYAVLDALPTSEWAGPFAETDEPSVQSEQTICSERANDPSIMSEPIPETTTEITTERESTPLPAAKVEISPGTPVNRRPDAPALVRAVPKPEKPPAQLVKWRPPEEFPAWYAETCAERGRDPTRIDLTAELQKFRAYPAHQTLKAGELHGAWQMWILRALDGMGQPRGGPLRPPGPPRRYLNGDHADEVA